MTFIDLRRERSFLSPLVIAALLVVLVEAGFLMYWYSETVEARRAIRDTEQALKETKLRSVVLRSELYALLDPAALERLARDEGFVLEARPRYLEVDVRREEDVLASELSDL